MAGPSRLPAAVLNHLAPGAGPWRKFPLEGAPADLRPVLPALPQALLEQAWKNARPDLKRYVKRELEMVEQRARQRGRPVTGFRPGAWPDAKVTEMIRVLLGRGNPSVTAGLAVMLLELDRELEDYLAAALAGEPDHEPELLCRNVESRYECKPHAALVARIAWAFRTYGRSEPMKPDNGQAVLPGPAPAQKKPDVLAAELTSAHADLVFAIGRVRELVGDLDRARPVAREEAATCLESALQAATLLRSRLAEAALRSPEVAGRSSETANELANVVSDASAALRAMALPSGRDQLQRLASELLKGRIVTKNPVRRASLEKARSAAAREATDGLTKTDSELLGFPGSEDNTSWLAWFWSVAAADADRALNISSVLETNWPSIYRYISSVDDDDWSDENDLSQPVPSMAISESMLGIVASNANAAGEAEPAGPVLGVDEDQGAGCPDPESAAPADGGARSFDARAVVDPEPSLASASETKGCSDVIGSALVPDMAGTGHSPLPDSSGPARREAQTTIQGGDDGANTILDKSGATVEGSTGKADGSTTLNAAMHHVVVSGLQPAGKTPTPSLVSVELNVPDFETFRKTHWVDREGKVVPAPWTHAGFLKEAGARLIESLQTDNWARAILFVSALDRLGSQDAPALDDIERAFNLRAGRQSPPSEEQEELVARARLLLSEETFSEDARHRLFVTLTLLAPGALNLLTDEETNQLTTFVGFSSRLRTFLQEWALVARRFPDPFTALARQLQAEGPGPVDDVRQGEEDARRALELRPCVSR